MPPLHLCIAAAVASEFNEDTSDPDKLEIFDTTNKNQRFFSAIDVLMASSDAPVYFETPYKVGDNNYVDGGLNGNCTLVAALPRLLKIFHDQNPELQTVISIAPPSQKVENIDDWFVGWAGYFPAQSTNGYKVYMASKEIYSGPSKATFARANPMSRNAQAFKMDEVDVDKMIRAIEDERINDPRYYNQILDMSALTVSRLEDVKLTGEFLAMMANVVADMNTRMSYDIAIRVGRNIIEKLQEAGKQSKIESSKGNTTTHLSFLSY